MTYETTTTDSAATQVVASRLSQLLKGGEIIELVSDLGGGKTTFVQGLARGLGYQGPVTSPTFTLSQIYQLPSGIELHHYDLYRLQEGGVVGQGLIEDLGDAHVVTVIEWAGIIHQVLPADRLRLEFEVEGETRRRLTFSAGGPRSAAILTELKA